MNKRQRKKLYKQVYGWNWFFKLNQGKDLTLDDLFRVWKALVERYGYPSYIMHGVPSYKPSSPQELELTYPAPPNRWWETYRTIEPMPIEKAAFHLVGVTAS